MNFCVSPPPHPRRNRTAHQRSSCGAESFDCLNDHEVDNENIYISLSLSLCIYTYIRTMMIDEKTTIPTTLMLTKSADLC